MSTLWTPGGERPVSPNISTDSPTDVSTAAEPNAPALTAEQEEQAKTMARELAEARQRLLTMPVNEVLINHALGIYELAAIHLTADQPKLTEAQLAIDALTALSEGLKGRLGEGEATLEEALHQARMAFVQRSSEAETPSK